MRSLVGEDRPWSTRMPITAAAAPDQLLGALVASTFVLAMFGDVGQLGVTVPGPRATDAQALVICAPR
jgi:hypothetical protein